MKHLLITLSLLSVFGTAEAQKKVYPRNNLKIIPAATFDLYFTTYDYSMGVAYERTFARDNRFSWSIPVYFGKNKVSDDSYYGTSTYKNFFKVNPGIKFYPFGQKTLSYGIGLSVFYLSGQIDESYPYSFVRYQIRQLGLMLNNSLSCNVSKRINLNLEIGYGPSFYNHFENEKDHFDNYNFKINTMRHANFSIGYRF